MKRKILTVAILSNIYCQLNAQAGNDFNKDVDNINKIFPAAPTSNNLMKFEEVPVSYYTGIPDISIPLFNIPTSNPNVNLNVQLKYHPLSAKPDDKAGETGLGWNLLAGGTITRTVRGGVADGKIESTFMSSPPAVKYGIYRHENNPTYKLIFDQLTNWNINEYAFYVGIGTYDTEYDLYQYNFMGYSGRFIIKKDPNGNFIAEKLDRNNLKITSTHDSGGEVQTITITDDKGSQYLFRGMETSSKNVSTVKVGLLNGSSDIATNIGGGIYFTAFHLEKVKDPSNNVLLTFTYDQASQVQYKDPETRTNRLAGNITYSYSNTTMNPDPQMPGAIEAQTVYNTANTKLLTSIAITDKGTVNFFYEKGRSDSNYLNAADLYKLKSIQSNISGQSNSQYVDKYSFDYDYSNTSFYNPPSPQGFLQKLLLKKITKSSLGNNLNEYNIAYNSFDKTFGKDNWGYYKGPEPYKPTYITQDVISSITYPTKGKVVFDFGENVYSHAAGFNQPMEPITGEWVDSNNTFTLDIPSFSPSQKKEFFTILSPQKVKLHLDLGSLIYSNWRFDIYQQTGSNTYSPSLHFWEMSWQSCLNNGNVQCQSHNPGENSQPITEFDGEVDLQPGTYYASFTGSYGYTQMPVSYNYTATTKEHYFTSYLTKKGGGLRVNNIKYFDDVVSTSPAKEFIYDYTDINDPQKSSGALVFPEPVFRYQEGITYEYHPALSDGYLYYSCTSDTTTNYNIIPSEKTQGSDVGYQYVTLRQIVRGSNNSITDNGRTVYKFRSPIDFPNPEMFVPSMPVLPITNHDYLRGQMVFEKKYDKDGKILSEVNNEYASYVFEKLEGIKARDNFYNNINPERYKYKYYSAFQQYFPQVILATPYKYFIKYGITLPSKKVETSYFYKNGVQSSVTSTTNSTYNSFDYPSLSTQLLADGSVTRTNYLYATEKNNQKLINANMISIPLETGVTQKLNTIVTEKAVAKTEVIYDPSTTSLFPDAVTGLNTLTNAMETKIKYDKYDNKGNLEEYTLKEGTPVTIIWGYNKTQPIAKLEGVRKSDIQQSLIDTIVNASNTDALAGLNNDESALLSALDTFRKTAVPGALITTYTYDPLVGVRSIIQPSGFKELYFYDTENRIKEIKQETRDVAGNVSYKTLKEYQYHFKN